MKKYGIFLFLMTLFALVACSAPTARGIAETQPPAPTVPPVTPPSPGPAPTPPAPKPPQPTVGKYGGKVFAGAYRRSDGKDRWVAAEFFKEKGVLKANIGRGQTKAEAMNFVHGAYDTYLEDGIIKVKGFGPMDAPGFSPNLYDEYRITYYERRKNPNGPDTSYVDVTTLAYEQGSSPTVPNKP